MVAFKGFKPPSKRILLKNNTYHLELWPELGGSVARFDWVSPNGKIRPLFRPATEGKETYLATDLGCFPLFPYSNRIANGRMDYNGKVSNLDLTIEGHPHALHGVGWQRPWTVSSLSETEASLTLSHFPDSYWPFAFSGNQTFRLTEAGLEVVSEIANENDQTMPYGLGLHPYICRPEGTKLSAKVAGVWLTDETVMPTVHAAIPDQWNLPAGCKLDGVFMDNCFDGLDGAVKVQWPDGAQLKIEGADNLKFLVVYNPPAEDYVCVEPVSHMTDAVNRVSKEGAATGFTALRPGEKAQTTHRFSFSAPD